MLSVAVIQDQLASFDAELVARLQADVSKLQVSAYRMPKHTQWLRVNESDLFVCFAAALPSCTLALSRSGAHCRLFLCCSFLQTERVELQEAHVRQERAHRAKLAELEQRLAQSDGKHAAGTVEPTSILTLAEHVLSVLSASPPAHSLVLCVRAFAELREVRDEFEQQRSAQVTPSCTCCGLARQLTLLVCMFRVLCLRLPAQRDDLAGHRKKALDMLHQKDEQIAQLLAKIKVGVNLLTLPCCLALSHIVLFAFARACACVQELSQGQGRSAPPSPLVSQGAGSHSSRNASSLRLISLSRSRY